jgi:prevent-host-death family protein
MTNQLGNCFQPAASTHALYSYVQRSTIVAMTSMTVSEARAALPELLSRVQDGEEVTITRHGRPVAVLVRPDALRSRRARAALDDAERIHELLAEAAATGLPEGSGLTAQRAEELISEIRAGRDDW